LTRGFPLNQGTVHTGDNWVLQSGGTFRHFAAKAMGFQDIHAAEGRVVAEPPKVNPL